MADTETVGFPSSSWSAQAAANNIAFSFAASHPAAHDYAIFQTHDPWNSTVLKNAITNAGHTYTVFTPAQLATVTFSDYRVVILNWDDTYPFEFQPAYGNAIAALEAYVNSGGVVYVQGAFRQFGPTNYPLPFGGTATQDPQAFNFIVDTASPLATGLPSPIIAGTPANQAHLAGYPANALVVVVTGVDNTGLATLYTLQQCQ